MKIRVIGLLLFAIVGAYAPALAAAVPVSEPADLAALRADRSATVEVLHAQALALNRRADDPVRRAWLMLAQAEFEDEMEHPDRAMDLLTQVLDTARLLKLRDLELAAYARRASMQANRGQTRAAVATLDTMNLIAHYAQDAGWLAETRYQMGVLDRKDGRPDLAIAHFQRAREYYETIEDSDGLAHTINAMGMIYGRIGRFSDALIHHNEALQIATERQDRQEMARSHRLLGNLYRNLQDEQLGAENMKRALTYLEPRDRRESIALRGELGKSLLTMGKLEDAAQFAEVAARDADMSGSPPNKVNAYTTLAEVRLAQGRLDEAKKWSDRAMTQFNNVALRDQVLLRLSELKILSALGQYQEARVQGGRTVYDARRLGDKVLEREALNALSGVQLALGDAEAAFESRKAYENLDRTLSLETASRQIAGLEANLVQQKVEAEKSLLARDNQIQSLLLTRQRWIGIALICGLLAVLAGLAFVSARFRESQRLNAELKASRDELSRLHSALVETAAALDRAANTDALTQLPNRRATMAALDAAQEISRTERRPLVLCLADIDRFKQINDSHGHASGDLVLREFARRLRQNLPVSAHAGRWGGEEFLLALSSRTLAEAEATVETLRQAIANEPFPVESGQIAVTASFGITAATDPESESLVALLARADQALYRAKSNGRNRIETAT